MVDRGALDRALAVLRGAAPAPDRADADDWIETTDALRDLVWGGIL